MHVSTTTITLLLPFSSTALHLSRRSDPKVLAIPIQHIPAPTGAIEHLNWKRASSVQVPMNSDRYYSHDVNITLGNPPQALRTLIDTGSAFTLIHANGSDFCAERRDVCTKTGSYAANSSLTYRYIESGFGAGYHSGEMASGDFVMDEMGFGGIKVKDAQIELMYTGNCTENVLGLGSTTAKDIIHPLHDKSPHESILSQLVRQKIIESRAFSLYIHDLNQPGGELLFGGVDTEKYEGSLLTIPFIERVRKTVIDFSISLNNVRMTDPANKTTILSSKFEPVHALLDSGNAATVLPDEIVNQIYSRLHANTNATGKPTVDCSLIKDASTIDFEFENDLVIKVALSQIIFPLKGASECPLWGIVKSSSVNFNSIVLGSSFLSSAYVVFDIDNEEASIAQAKQNPTASNILQITSGPNAVPGAFEDWDGEPMVGETINDWEYLGCAEETVPRTIASHSVFAPNMTIESCLDTCEGRNYRLAALQFADECWCGNTMLHESATGARGCNMPCKGNAEQICGGHSRLSVFEHKKYKAIGNPSIVHGYGYKGCFREKSIGRLLDGAHVRDQDDMSAGKCMAFCQEKDKKFLWAGLQYGKECFCSKTFPALAIPAPEEDCSMLCSGNNKEWCGGSSRLSVYKYIDSP